MAFLIKDWNWGLEGWRGEAGPSGGWAAQVERGRQRAHVLKGYFLTEVANLVKKQCEHSLPPPTHTHLQRTCTHVHHDRVNI